MHIVHEEKEERLEKKTRGIAFIHPHNQHICVVYILIFCQGLHILISIKRAKMQNHSLMQMKVHFNKCVTRLYNLRTHTHNAWMNRMHMARRHIWLCRTEPLLYSLFILMRVCLCSAWFELTCSISRHRAFIIRKKNYATLHRSIYKLSYSGGGGERYYVYFCLFHLLYVPIQKVFMTV